MVAHPENIAVHACQDTQHILSTFVEVPLDAALTRAVTSGNNVALSSHRDAMDVADGLISSLRAILHGNGEGTLKDHPSCAAWFLKGTPAREAQAPAE